jgi:hypothetical protein
MAHRTDAAEPLDEHRCFPIRSPLYESLEPAKLDDMQARLDDAVVVI